MTMRSTMKAMGNHGKHDKIMEQLAADDFQAATLIALLSGGDAAIHAQTIKLAYEYYGDRQTGSIKAAKLRAKLDEPGLHFEMPPVADVPLIRDMKTDIN
jgi:hypothetical protein